MQMIGAIAGEVGNYQAQQQQIQNLQAEAVSVEEAAKYEETKTRRELAIIQGNARAITAATGVDPSSGSPLLLELDNARQAEIEALNIRRTGQMAAEQKRREATQLKKTAAWGVLSLGGNLGSAGSSALSDFYNWRSMQKTNVRAPGGDSGYSISRRG